MKIKTADKGGSPKDFYTLFTKFFPLIVLVIVVAFFSAFTGGKVLASYNLLALSQKIACVIILSMGALFVIAQGSIDMSVGANMGISGIIAAMVAINVGVWALFPVAILVGTAIGLFNGLIVAKGHSGSFLVTLATSIALAACKKLLLNTSSVVVGEDIKAIIGLKFMLPILIIVVAVVYYIFERTKVGYFIKAIGENELACRYAGVQEKNYKLLGFVICGFLAGVAGAMTVSRLGGANYATGAMSEMTAMIAIFLGGVLVTGGMQSKLYKVLIGAIVVSILENGMNISGIDSTWNEAIRGIVLIAVVVLTNYLDRKRNLKAGNKMSITL